jgi:hypothetical protein
MKIINPVIKIKSFFDKLFKINSFPEPIVSEIVFPIKLNIVQGLQLPPQSIPVHFDFLFYHNRFH